MAEPGSDELDCEVARLAGRHWAQMLARAGVSQMLMGDVDSPFGQFVEGLASDDQVSEPELAGVVDTSSPPVATIAETPAPLESMEPAPIVRRGGPSRVTPKTLSGANPALKHSGDVVDDGLPLQQFADLPDPQRHTQLQILNQQVTQCTRCPDLVANRTQTVFGVGNLRPRLIMMGEAPGADEDRQGEPMVGAAGQLLDKIIGAMKLKREDVYILNTVKCRPPQNRNPTEEECGHCREFWRQQIEILKPDCIVCLGAVASKTLLQTASPVGRLRGQFHDYRGVPVAVTYHPAYLLRTESAKRQTWEDMKMVMQLLGIPLE